MRRRVRVLFVCMGNICRSPMAEGVFRKLVVEAGLQDRVDIDSAGTLDYHSGEAPDPRAVAASARRGVAIEGLRARQVGNTDCGKFDLVVAMDRGNLNRLRRMCQGGEEPRLLMDFATGRREHEVPDPYASGPEAFEYVLDLIEAGARGLLAEVERRLAASGA